MRQSLKIIEAALCVRTCVHAYTQGLRFQFYKGDGACSRTTGKCHHASALGSRRSQLLTEPHSTGLPAMALDNLPSAPGSAGTP